jgi:DNA-binding SARP family transcriptional activator/tetratricopeptide (TPR) repeat protein
MARWPLRSVSVQLRLSQSPALVAPSGASTALAPRDAALLAWLALEGPTPRTRLAQLLWPESEPEAARNALRQRLFQLTKLHRRALVTGSSTLALAEGLGHDLADSDAVLGDTPAESTEFGAWLAQQRQRRHGRMRQSLVELSDMAEQARDYADAISHAGELLALEPLSEDAHRRVMRLHYLAGDRAAGLLAFDRCEQVLKDEVGARPSPLTLALLDTLQASERAPGVQERRLPAAVLRPPRLVGRNEDLRAALAGWTAQQVVWVVGEAGMGKSRLLQELVSARPGSICVSARPGDAVVPYASLARLLRAVVERAPQALGAAPLAGVARLLPEVAPAGAGSAPGAVGALAGGSPAAQQVALQRGVVALLRAAQAAGVEALALDDLHFADDASLEMLLVVLHGDALPGLAWAFAQRPSEGSEHVAQVQETLLEEQRLQPLRLAPLSVAQLLELVTSLSLDGVDAAALAAQLHRHTGGNPLFALETLRQAWVDGGLGAVALPRPGSVARLIERRLSRLSTAAVRLARCGAVAGQDFSIELATAVLGVPVLDLADAWTELEQAQVLRDGAFAHDLIFEAVLASVPQPIAQHLHGQIAAFLDRPGGEPARLAWHWAEAHQWAPAAAAFTGAAQRAQHGARVLDAAVLLAEAARCHALAGALNERFEALLARAEILSVFELGDQAVAAVAELEAAAQNELQRLKTLQVRLTLSERRFEEEPVLELAPDAIRAAHALGQTALEVSFAMGLAYALCARRRAAEAVTLLERYDAAFETLDDTGLHFEYLMALGFALDYADRLRDALAAWDRALALPRIGARADLLWQAMSSRAATLSKMGQVRLAAETGEQALRMARSTGDMPEVRLMKTQSILAHRLRDIGRYADAMSWLEEARAVFDAAPETPSEIAHIEHRMVVIYQHLGQPERAPALLKTEHAGLQPGLAMMRLVHRADSLRQLGGDGLPLMREALAVIPDPNDIYYRIASLFMTWLVPPDEGEALGASLAVWAGARERFGVALAGHVRAAACGLALGAPARAQPHVEAALTLAREHQPDTFYLPELWLVAARVFQALGRTEDAKRSAGVGRDWVMAVHDQQVPEVFRPSFLQRNPINHELLSLAARLTVS